MNLRITHHLMVALLSVAFTTTLHAQTTAFTYQGQLNDNGSPATGTYDLQFTIYDAETGGSVLAGPVTNSPAEVSNGVFTVTLDFGAGVFDGSDRWLEIGGQIARRTPTTHGRRPQVLHARDRTQRHHGR